MKIPVIYSLLLLLFGCSGVTPVRDGSINLAIATQLNGEVIVETILTPIVTAQGIAADKLVLIYPDTSNTYGHIYTKQGKLLSSFAKQGKGPADVMFVSNLTTSSSNPRFTTYDPTQKRLIYWNSQAIIDNQSSTPTNQQLPDVGMSVYFANNTPHGLLFYGSAGDNKQERLLLLDSMGQITGPYNNLPSIKDTILIKGVCMNASITMSPDASKYAVATPLGAILETFNIVPNAITLESETHFIKPDFEHDDLGNPLSFDNIMQGFGSLTSSDEHIYACYNGTTDYKQMKNIVVFDWKGNVKNIFKTDFHLMRICYDDTSNAIFATVLADNNEYQLVRFNLPK